MRQQPGRQRPVAGMLDDVLADQLPHHLRRRQVLLGADFLEHGLLARIEEQGQARVLDSFFAGIVNCGLL